MTFPIEFHGIVSNMKRINTRTGKEMHIVTVGFMGGSRDFFFPDSMIPDVLMGQSVKVSCSLNLASFRLEDVRIHGV